MSRASESKLLRRYLARPYLHFNKWIWDRIPTPLRSSRMVGSFGRHLHGLVRLRDGRRMSVGTFFFRNRPELECMRRLACRKAAGSSLNIAIFGCSKGVEVYSICFIIRSARPDLRLAISAFDIAKEVLELGETGVYSLRPLDGMDWPDSSLIAKSGELVWKTWQGQNVSLFGEITESEMKAMFEQQGDQVRVKSEIREGITWQIGDASDSELVKSLQLQDLVVANNFLCHMTPKDAGQCLRNLGRLVKPGGHIFVTGVDLDVRTSVALELGWKPLVEDLKQIHEGDQYVRLAWPWNYCGLEPLDSSRPDWKTRYASVFQIGQVSE